MTQNWFQITERPSLTLKDDGTFSASTDCNSMGGKYEAVDKQITFGEHPL